MQLNFNLSQTSHSVISFFVRKELDLFISQKKKAKRKLLLFCDNNNNGIKDAGESALSYFRIMLEHQLIETNKHGEVLLENIPEQGIRIDIDGTSFQEWIPAGGYAQRIEKVMNGVIMLPFSRAGSIKGRLVVKRDKMTSSFTDIHGIRITATTAAGKTYTTLTDSEGRYMLNLPVNVYRVSINSKAINNGFSIIDPQQVVDLLQNSQPDLDFIIVQEKRQLNIKKQ